MTNINNFDQSSTGVNIEFYGRYDNNLSRHYWEENYSEIDDCKNTFYFTCYGELENPLNALELTVKSRSRKTDKEFADELKAYISKMYNFDITDTDTIETLSEIIVNEFDKNELIDYLYNKNHFSEPLYAWAEGGYAETGLEVCFKKDPDYIDINGYCQGDFARVYFDIDAVRKLWGTPETTSDDELETMLRKQFEQQFYDSPVSAYITINDNDYSYYDCPDADEYAWKRNEFLQWAAEKSGVDIALIDAVVPKELPYE